MGDPLPHEPRPCAVLMTLHRADALPLFTRALASVEAQAFDAPIRVYLCIDGPLFAEQNEWLRHNEGRFHVVLRNPACLGLARSLNRLIDALEDEELVFRMDGDDISLPDRFAKQAAMMRSRPELTLIGAQATDMDEDGSLLGPRRFPVGEGLVRATLARANPVLHPTYCIRREALRDPELRYPHAYLCEDLAFLVVLAERGHRFDNHPDILFQWRTAANFFDRRRDWRRGWVEMLWYYRALRIGGKFGAVAAVLPAARFALRLLPTGVMRRIYRSPLRDRILGSAGQAAP